MVPDVSGLDREFDYLVPAHLDNGVRVGTSVRVPLHGRRVAGWVVADGVGPSSGSRLLPLRAVRGLGPGPDVVELAYWAAWRWAGRPAAFLRSASAPRLVTRLPTAAGWSGGGHAAAEPWDRAFGGGGALVRLAPATDRWPAVEAVVSRLRPGGTVLVLCPGLDDAERVAARLGRRGVPVALMPDRWAEAAAGGRVVVGARAAAWAPAPDLAAVLVLDGHEEAYKEERAPAWQAWEVAAERARRAGAPCVVTSACPTLELLEWARERSVLVEPARPEERAGWAVVEVVDRRGDDPRSGLFSERLVHLLRSVEGDPGRPVVCVLNRKGRARLLACRSCGVLVRCHACDAPMTLPRQSEEVRCGRCGQGRPALCVECGASRLSLIRSGVSRLVEEVAALTGVAVAEVSADFDQDRDRAKVVVGTEAVLHRARRATAVAFLDFDQELLAPRFRAAEEALALLARAARMVGGRPGRVLVQTRLPDHDVLGAAAAAEPARLAQVEDGRRRALSLPPYSSLALVSGEESAALAGALGAAGLAVAGLDERRWLVRAPDQASLCDALAASRPKGPGVRVEVDPLRV